MFKPYEDDECPVKKFLQIPGHAGVKVNLLAQLLLKKKNLRYSMLASIFFPVIKTSYKNIYSCNCVYELLISDIAHLTPVNV